MDTDLYSRIIFLRGDGGTGGQGTRDRGPGTGEQGQWEQVEARDTAGIEHIGIHWIQTFRVTFFRGKEDWGQGTRDRGAGTSRGKRHDIEHIGLHVTGDREKDTTFYDLLLSTLWGQGGQDLDALERE